MGEFFRANLRETTRRSYLLMNRSKMLTAFCIDQFSSFIAHCSYQQPEADFFDLSF